MPKTIKNLLREGLPSKIYLLAYNGPISGYEAAQKIQGLMPGKVPQTSKIYGWIKEMKGRGFLRDFQGGYLSNIEPLIDEIRQFLAENHSIILTDLECYMVGKLLNNDSFRNLVEYSYFYKRNFFDGEVDAAHEIMEVLGDHEMHTYAFSEESDSPVIRRKSDFDLLWNKYNAPSFAVLPIEKSLHDKTLELLTILENDKGWQAIEKLTETLKLTIEELAAIVGALTKVGYTVTEGCNIRISENPPEEMIFESEELQRKCEEFTAEEKYFQRTGNFKPGGIYEQMYKQGQLAIDGKKIKQWAFPIPSSLLPRTLVGKLCRLSSTYYLFQKLQDGKTSRLYAEWSRRKLRFSAPP